MLPRIVTSIEDFLEQEFSTPREDSRVVVFRGHSNSKYKWQPTLYRSKSLEKAEDALISELLIHSPEEFAQDRLAFEQLVRARHYGLPARLLDVTLNPLVALYFACQPTYDNTIRIESPVDGELVRFDISNNRVKFFDSDTISLISNLSRLRYDEKECIRKFLSKYRSLTGRISASGIPKAGLQKKAEIERLIQFVRVEKPYFKNNADPSDLLRYFLVHPRQSSKRLVAQSGAFIASGFFRTLRTNSSSAFAVDRFRIRHRYKSEILNKLDRLNINMGTMFPEMENASNYLKKKYSK